MILQKQRRGSVLILSLWTLSILTVFSVQIGLTIRQRISLISRLEDRSQLRYVVSSGVYRAIAALRLDYQRVGSGYTASAKLYRHNNAGLFQGNDLGRGRNDVSYPFWNSNRKVFEKRFGVEDEEGKININTASMDVIQRLFEDVLSLGQDEARGFAEAIVDWREIGKMQLTGFYSDDYYQRLEFPYEPKNSVFESFDEILFVKGFNASVLKRLLPFITVFGDGRVNINTASKPVLMAIGFSDIVAQKILVVRAGFDGVEATADDHVFSKTYDISSGMKAFVEMKNEEMRQIDRVNKRRLIKTKSFLYRIISQGYFPEGKQVLVSEVVYDLALNRIEYWSEKK